MNIDELENFIIREELEWSRDNIENMPEEEFKKRSYLYVKSNHWNTCVRLDLDELDKWSEALLLKGITQGKNVVKMTRVTGFFSNIGQWNPGKRGELKDRFRVRNFGTEK
ncbi:MAG: hypothetical protein AB1485_00795 [Candidatus Thermoplasmatota archaeon]